VASQITGVFHAILEKPMRTFLLCAGLIAGLGLPAWAGFETGLAAFGKGDYETAYREWRPLARRGEPAAQFRLAALFLDGLGVDRDEAKAAGLLQKAAEAGHTEAQLQLALLYGTGRGVPQDYEAAAAWYRRVADKGDPRGQAKLGYMVQMGHGMAKNTAEALRLYRKAAAQGDAEGQLNLGVLYATGQATPQDFVQAHMWFNLAAARGNEVAARNRDELANKMAPRQVAEAQRLARAWVPPAKAKAAPRPVAKPVPKPKRLTKRPQAAMGEGD
jgi:TPR repeat protein